jgi:hypothetical protein
MVDKKLRTSFFVSLHQAFKSDFTHIISPNLAEFRYLISGKFKRIAKFFKQVDAKFIALDYALSYLPDKAKEIFARYHYVPREASWTQQVPTLEKVACEAVAAHLSSEASEDIEDVSDIFEGLSKHASLLEVAYHKTFKTYSVQGIQTPHSELPLHNLPVEIIEHIITIDDEIVESFRPLFCVSRQMNALKGKIKWQTHLKLQNPLKCRTIEQSTPSNSAILDWSGYYMKHNRINSNWRNGNFAEIEVRGFPCDLNEEIGLYYFKFWNPKKTSRSAMWHEGDRSDLTSDILSQTDAYFYWFRFSEFNNKDEPVNFYCVKDIDGANICIIKSDSPRVQLAMTKNGTLWLHDGTNRVDSISYEASKYGHLVPQPFCKNDRILVGISEVIIGERMTSRKLFEEGSVLDMNVFNGIRVCEEDTLASPFYSTWVQATSQHVKLFVRSKDNEMIGQLLQMGNMETTSSAAFLDEFTIVYGCRNKFLQKIAFGDTRKLGAYFDAFDIKEEVLLDALNGRAIARNPHRIRSVYDLKTKQLQSALLLTESFADMRLCINSRYWCRKETIVDFGI